jgi:type I restriction enzyme S subunit
MGGEWKTLPLQDCMAAIIDYRGKSPEKTTFGVPLVTAKIVKGGRIDKPEEFIAEVDFDNWMRRGMPKPGDIVMTTEAPLGEVAQLDGRKVALAQRVITLRGKPDILDNKFLKFLLQSNPVQEELRSRGTGTTVVGIRQSELRKVSLTLPPLDEQKAIAAVLGTLDDKIELNWQMNVTLEAMARALFQSWFVDFDPVRTKLDGRQPFGMDKATAALFPDSFQDSEAGHIPKGWEITTLSELTTVITKGTTPTQSDMTGAPDTDASINYVRVNSIEEDGSILSDKLTKIPESVHAGVLKRSVLLANDVLYTIAGTIGRIALAEDWMLPANTNQAVAIIRPEPDIPSGFLVLTMRHDEFREELHNNIVHAVQANLSLGMLSKARLVIPPRIHLSQLFAPIDALLSQISANRAQSRTLATLRDTLMPKLLSGELNVNELDAAVS